MYVETLWPRRRAYCNMHVSSVLEYALELCDNKKNGGRIAVLSKWQGQLLDCSYWPDEYSQAVRARFPQCTITFISAQDVSSTGFYIYFNLEESSIRLRRSDLALLAYCAYFLVFRRWLSLW